MKKITLFILCCSIFISSAISQTVRISSNVGNLIRNAHVIGQRAKFTQKNAEEVIIAHEEGYVTEGMVIQEILDKNQEEYTIKLKKISIPKEELGSKRIEFTKYIDPNDKLTKDTYYSVYGYSGVSKGVDFDDKMFKIPFITQAKEWGYDVIEEGNSVFKEKQEVPDLAIAGEIIKFAKETKGTPGFKVTVWVHWSIFDVEKEKVTYEFNSAGYSNTKKANKFQDELALALNDAAIALLDNDGFKNIAIDDGSTDRVADKDVYVLPKITSNSEMAYGQMIGNSIKSGITVKTEYGHGSGFVISSNGYALTNYHVIIDANEIEAIFNNELTLPAKVVAYDKKRDVALLKIVGGGFSSLAIIDKTIDLEVGTEVVAIGTPADVSLGQSVTKGIISGNRVFKEKTYIQTDVSINAGNSGGALINMNGEVVGITVAKLSGENIEGLGFAIPIHEALDAINIQFE